MFLGSAETVGTFTNLFTQFKGKSQLYRRMAATHLAQPVEFPVSFSPDKLGLPERPAR